MALRPGKPPAKKTTSFTDVVNPMPEVAVAANDPLATLREKMSSSSVAKAMVSLEKDYDFLQVFGPGKPMPKIEVLPTGIPEVDHIVLGRGGFPRGRIVEISGGESSGKTTFFLHCIASFQRQGLVCAFIDLEIAMDGEYATACGVDTDLWFYMIPLDGEEAIAMAERCLDPEKMGVKVDVVIFDSTGAMRSSKAMDKEIGERVMADRSRLQDDLINKIKRPIFKTQALFGLVSQVRVNMNAGLFGKQHKATTGKALDHEFCVRLEVFGGSKIKGEDGAMIGRSITFTGIKNKIGKQDQKCTIEMVYGEGLSRECMILDAALRSNVLAKSGAWIYLPGGERIGQGRDQAKAFLKLNPHILDQIEAQVNEVMATKKVVDVPNIPRENDQDI